MVANDKQDREARTRLRAYQARQAAHERTVNRRKRDNIVVAAVFVVVTALLIALQLSYFSGGPGTPEPVPSPTATPTPTAPAEGQNSGDVPSPDLAENRTWTGTLTLNDIPLGIELDGAAAPQAVASEISLVQAGFYDDLSCHRLTTAGIFVLQCGDPAGDGTGGPGYTYGPVENAPADAVYPAGTIAMARAADPYSHGSQFFIVYQDSTIGTADDAYTVIGRVTSGLDELIDGVVAEGVADGQSDGAPTVPVTITGFTIQ